jgi:hypothetical protein
MERDLHKANPTAFLRLKESSNRNKKRVTPHVPMGSKIPEWVRATNTTVSAGF